MIRDSSGDYFPSVSDDNYINGPLLMGSPTTGTVRLCGRFISANPDLYEVICGKPDKNNLIQSAIKALNSGENRADVEVLLNQALLG